MHILSVLRILRKTVIFHKCRATISITSRYTYNQVEVNYLHATQIQTGGEKFTFFYISLATIFLTKIHFINVKSVVVESAAIFHSYSLTKIFLEDLPLILSTNNYMTYIDAILLLVAISIWKQMHHFPNIIISHWRQYSFYSFESLSVLLLEGHRIPQMLTFLLMRTEKNFEDYGIS